MDCATIQPAIKILLTEISRQTGRSRTHAKAAACTEAGSISESVSVSMDIEQPIYEAGRLHDAASLLDGMSRE
jgi:hypothetical protein